MTPPQPPFPVPSFLVPPNPFSFPPLKAAQEHLLDTVNPSLTPEEEVYVRSLIDLGATMAGVDPNQNFDLERLIRLISSGVSGDEASVKEILNVISKLGSNSEQGHQLRNLGSQVLELVGTKYSDRFSQWMAAR